VVSAVVFGAFDLRFVDPDEFDLEFPRHRRLAHSKRSSFKMTALSYLVDDEIDIQIKAALQEEKIGEAPLPLMTVEMPGYFAFICWVRLVRDHAVASLVFKPGGMPCSDRAVADFAHRSGCQATERRQIARTEILAEKNAAVTKQAKKVSLTRSSSLNRDILTQPGP
jgi:hypothetical protein